MLCPRSLLGYWGCGAATRGLSLVGPEAGQGGGGLKGGWGAGGFAPPPPPRVPLWSPPKAGDKF